MTSLRIGCLARPENDVVGVNAVAVEALQWVANILMSDCPEG